MDALGLGGGSSFGILSGTEVAQKLSDSILAGRIVTASNNGDNRGVSLTYSGYTIFYLILSNQQGYSISTVATSSNTVQIPNGGYWREGTLYGYKTYTGSSSYVNNTAYGILIPIA